APTTRWEEGRPPAQPRPPHGRPLGRRGGVVVHHDGAVVPGAAPGVGGGGARADRLRDGEAHGVAGRLAHLRLPELPAAVRQGRAGAARPARLTTVRCGRGSPPPRAAPPAPPAPAALASGGGAARRPA